MASDVSNNKKRPLSISSVSSSSTSSCSSLTRNGSLGMADTKKSYLASIESLDDADDTDDDSLGIIRMIRAKVNDPLPLSPSSLSTFSFKLFLKRSEFVSVLYDSCHRLGARHRVGDDKRLGYLQHMKTFDESKITAEEILNLFSNIEDIYLFNSDFLSQLEECGLNPVSIANCFITKSLGFDIYTHYCTNYPRTVSLLTEMMRNTDRAEIFRERQLSLKHSLPLGSYLLKPVQRILKYHLLLQNIVKYTDKETNDYIDVRNALSVMTNIAIHINDMKRKHEHAVRVQEIQSLLYNWPGQDLTTYGDLQCEGSFRMFGAKGFRHLFLFDRMLLMTKKKDDGSLSFKTHILCSNLMLIESIQGQPLCFHAIPFDQPRAQYTFQARNLEHKREWCLLLKRVILENYDVVIPSHAKQIVMQLGQTANGGHTDSHKTHTNSKRTLSAPEYLERRKQENRRKSEATVNHNLSKGFKLRKSLKKIHYMDGHNGWRRSRSSSYDESARTHTHCNDGEQSERRSSLGPIDLNASQTDILVEKLESSSPSKPVTGMTGVGTGAHNQPKLVDRSERSTQELTEEKTDNESLNQIHDLHNILELRPPPRTVTVGHREMNDMHNENEAEYVTFYISPNNRLDSSEDSSVQMSNSSSTLYNRTSTPLSSGSSDLSMASSSQSEDSKYVVLPVNALISYSHLSSPIVRRVQSFTGMTRSKAMLQHTLSLRHSLAPDLPPTPPNRRLVQRPNTLNLCNSSSIRLPSCNSLDEMSPTAPAIWLKRQEQHFADACKKGGSLPRSFETTSFAPTNEDNCQTTPTNRLRMGTHGEQRPFTIAADGHPLNGEYIDTGIETYIDIDGNKCFKSSDSHDDMKCSDNSSSISLENMSDQSVLHPEHKIYKHSASKYIKSVIFNVSSKLVSLRRSPTVSDQLCGDSASIISGESVDRCESPAVQPNRCQNNNKANESSKYEMSPKLITARFVHTLAKVYSNIIKNKLKNSSKIETEMTASKALSEIPSPVFARISVPKTSSAAAARLAAYNHFDCDENVPKHRCGLQKHYSFRRPDSLVSDISNSSESNDKNDTLDGNADTLDDLPSDASDSSLDSFYEQTFEAIESVLTEEMFGESGFYSQSRDNDDTDISGLNTIDQFADDSEDNACYTHLNLITNLNDDKKQSIYKSIEELSNGLNLNILSAKRVKGAIIEKLKILEQNSRFHKDNNVCDFDGIKSIKERVEELENNKEKWSNNKENMDENDESSDESPKGSPKPNSKGWVKHVIGKLQND
ncbi:unnamed protein product [Medioppia subpectinata]|uniref:DH domain-containing protein n=1 Tax=Medioppia subpectinata TaxID=1979941 RepID=A0A7R9KL77_9ACAR|nr:unnamed protein product [Medioppia subpectinata]CAG2105283.1 unnamed protein product [Medioppia subpectinata]